MFPQEFKTKPGKLLKLSDQDFSKACTDDPNKVKNDIRGRLIRTLWLGIAIGAFSTTIIIGLVIAVVKLIQVI